MERYSWIFHRSRFSSCFIPFLSLFVYSAATRLLFFFVFTTNSSIPSAVQYLILLSWSYIPSFYAIEAMVHLLQLCHTRVPPSNLANVVRQSRSLWFLETHCNLVFHKHATNLSALCCPPKNALEDTSLFDTLVVFFFCNVGKIGCCFDTLDTKHSVVNLEMFRKTELPRSMMSHWWLDPLECDIYWDTSLDSDPFHVISFDILGFVKNLTNVTPTGVRFLGFLGDCTISINQNCNIRWTTWQGRETSGK